MGEAQEPGRFSHLYQAAKVREATRRLVAESRQNAERAQRLCALLATFAPGADDVPESAAVEEP